MCICKYESIKQDCVSHFYLSVENLEGLKEQWNSFWCKFESLSTWISEREKDLDTVKSSNAPLEQQINTVKV